MLDKKICGLYCYKSNRERCVVMSENLITGLQKIGSKDRLKRLLESMYYRVKIYKNGEYLAYPTESPNFGIIEYNKVFYKVSTLSKFSFIRSIDKEEFQFLRIGLTDMERRYNMNSFSIRKLVEMCLETVL